MKRLTAAQIRQMYLDYFESKGHAIEPSAPLVPIDDDSLLWINSGVATLKKYFDGRVIPDNPRITNAQKSIRTNDIENVGKTARHHTFFEMLGNFSIGDYFKKEAIEYAWDFLTNKQWIGFDPELLYVTVHPEDDEAYRIWVEEIGLEPSRIIRLEGNFWDIGEGPSGPNSEIFYDRGEKYGADFSDPELYPGGENERYLEIWNLVFSEFNHNPDGTYTPLPKQNIDTGMGLERMASVIQDVPTNFETDLFMPIIQEVEKMSGETYDTYSEKGTAFKVIADHIRTVAFAIGDGALPSNEGRGYVLRRLLRRAVRYAKQLGLNDPFMYKLVPTVGAIMEEFYPTVTEKSDFIQKVIKNEEDRFHETLHEGLAILENVIAEAKKMDTPTIAGKDAFRLYDTYGFPYELTEEYAEEANVAVDRAGFDEAMEAQRNRARAAREDVDSMSVQSEVLNHLTETSTFTGYDQLTVETTVAAIIQNGERVERIDSGEAQLVLVETPFYAESGGQIADAGTIQAETGKVAVRDVQKAPNGQNLHQVEVVEGTLAVGDTVTALVTRDLRKATIKNHTATHLLHKALKEVLGEHVNQAGSYVGPDRLRFDFSHFGQVTPEELAEIERKVNEQIWQDIAVQIGEYSLDEAKQMGAMALFGEKYGDVVRVVRVGDYSLELCGGCHVARTSEIGLFKIESESGIGAGTRRIEAVTGKQAYELLKSEEALLQQVQALVKANSTNTVQKVEGLLQQLKEMKKENESLQAKLGNSQLDDLLAQAVEVNGVKVLAAKVDAKDNGALRQMIDEVKQQIDEIIVVFGAVSGDKVMLAAGVSKPLTKTYKAGDIVNHVATQCDGRGGGRPDMAMAGAKDASKLDEALQSVQEYVKSI
ncbi:alanine--tRNA ligase [Savagea sp. SN6]|uniref:Alanine--tRNA ligase n=1 Tax=Savagea serpentis TaxID=2785297 RepID=A0A8J7G946_9BACL|nr:alanine--tRNA ligase [Savagea serpentis]MBF4500130.1 alanine--tRNA ligase [Savagea serpentis]